MADEWLQKLPGIRDIIDDTDGGMVVQARTDTLIIRGDVGLTPTPQGLVLDFAAGDGPGGAGDVVGPASATANRVAIFADPTGKLIADSGVPYTTLVRANGAVAFTADQSLGGNKLTNVGSGSVGTDGVNLAQVQALIASAIAGSAGGGGDGFVYTLSSLTADADPGAGVLRLNNATLASVTQIYIDLVDADGNDITTWLDRIDDAFGTAKGYIRVGSRSDRTKWILYKATGLTTTTGYRKIPVTHVGTGTGGAPSTTASDVFFSFESLGFEGTVPVSSGGTGLTSISAANRVLASTNGTSYTTTQIVDAMVAAAAAIDGSKINPAFGSGNISTTGTLATGAATITGNITLGSGADRTIGFATLASGTGAALTHAAQDVTTGTGGKYTGRSGAGSTNDGDVELTRGTGTSVFLATTANTVVRSASNVLVSVNGVTRIQVTSSVIAIVVADFRFDTAVTGPMVRQNPTSTASTVGQPFLWAAQDVSGNGSTGGASNRRGGDSTGASGTRVGGDIYDRPGTGATANGNWGWFVQSTDAVNFQNMQGGVYMKSATAAPTANPSGGGFLYVEAGALKYRGPTTGVTTIAPA